MSEVAETLRALAEVIEADEDVEVTLDLDVYYPTNVTREMLVELAKRTWVQQMPNFERHVRITIHNPGPHAWERS